jgi:ankyrin repeat protein
MVFIIFDISHFFDMLELLLSNGADINAVAKNSITPLVMSFLSHKIDLSKYLTEKGADASVKPQEELCVTIN